MKQQGLLGKVPYRRDNRHRRVVNMTLDPHIVDAFRAVMRQRGYSNFSDAVETVMEVIVKEAEDVAT